MMETFQRSLEIRWSDLDPNFHVLHSKYYDFGAYCRMAIMVDAGITPAVMQEYHIGPILLKESCTFRKELRFGDQVTISLQLESAHDQYTRFTMYHEIFRNDDTLAAQIHAELAWMDTIRRKLAVPPEQIICLMDQMPRKIS